MGLTHQVWPPAAILRRVMAFLRVIFGPFKAPRIGSHRGVYIGQFGVNFSKFFSRSFSTRDGFLTLPNDDLAGFNRGTCVFGLIFVPFNPFAAGRKVPFFVPLQCSLSLYIYGIDGLLDLPYL